MRKRCFSKWQFLFEELGIITHYKKVFSLRFGNSELLDFTASKLKNKSFTITFPVNKQNAVRDLGRIFALTADVIRHEFVILILYRFLGVNLSLLHRNYALYGLERTFIPTYIRKKRINK